LIAFIEKKNRAILYIKKTEMQKKGEPIIDIKADDITRLDWSLTVFFISFISRCDECTYDVPRQNLTCLDCEAGFYGPYCVACNSNCGSTGNSEICMQDGK
jgi:hypothetical protein